MPFSGHISQPRHCIVVLTVGARAIWSRFASPRAELVDSPSFSRPNLFAGD
jgi:hypothetical protein